MPYHHSKRREYKIWSGMKHRCERQSNPNFKDYGGRGISVCQRWASFINFLDDLGPAPSAIHSLDRINNDGNYEPGNCRWATPSEQGKNRRSARHLELGGVKKTLSEWCVELDLIPRTVTMRLSRGLSVEAALYAGKYPAGRPRKKR